uniref:Prohibitin n=1 Tax=Cercocebus atys TaxID=9531 RepID=A0A2K5LXA1_CERAT
MAQNLKDLARRLSAGPRGMGTALKLLLGTSAMAYGVRESVFTVEGGHRAIFFNWISGVQQDTILISKNLLPYRLQRPTDGEYLPASAVSTQCSGAS